MITKYYFLKNMLKATQSHWIDTQNQLFRPFLAAAVLLNSSKIGLVSLQIFFYSEKKYNKKATTEVKRLILEVNFTRRATDLASTCFIQGHQIHSPIYHTNLSKRALRRIKWSDFSQLSVSHKKLKNRIAVVARQRAPKRTSCCLQL